MEFEEGEVYKVVNKAGNVYVGFAYKPSTLEWFAHKLLFSSVVLGITPMKLNKKFSLDFLQSFVNIGMIFSEGEVKKMTKLTENK